MNGIAGERGPRHTISLSYAGYVPQESFPGVVLMNQLQSVRD